MAEQSSDTLDRRTFLQVAGAAGATAALGGVAGASGATGTCGESVATSTVSGRLDYGQTDTYTFGTDLSSPCKVTYTLTMDDYLDADLYVTLDGREPTPYDYDRRSSFGGSGDVEEVVIEDANVQDGSDFGVAVNAYSGEGEYTLDVRELGTSDDGGDGGQENEVPSASMDVEPYSVKPGEVVEFEAYGSSDPDGSIVAYDWEFGDGETATGRTAEHTYDEPGYYSVALTVTDDSGATDTTFRSVDVYTDEPRAAFSIEDASVKHGIEVVADAAGSEDPDGSVESYHWEFGDGTTGTGRVARHRYDEAGQYTITLTVEDNHGATDTTSQTVTIKQGCGRAHNVEERTGTLADDGSATLTYATQTEDPCQVEVSLNSKADANLDLYVNLDGGAPTPDDYDRKSTGEGAEEMIALAADEVGVDTELGVMVDAARSDGNYRLTIHEYGVVHNSAPTAKITASTLQAKEGESVTFDASDSVDPDGDRSIESYEWNFGDGGWFSGPVTKSGQVVSHSFSSGGSHDVTLTITDEWGASDTTTVTVDVEENWWVFW